MAAAAAGAGAAAGGGATTLNMWKSSSTLDKLVGMVRAARPEEVPNEIVEDIPKDILDFAMNYFTDQVLTEDDLPELQAKYRISRPIAETIAAFRPVFGNAVYGIPIRRARLGTPRSVIDVVTSIKINLQTKYPELREIAGEPAVIRDRKEIARNEILMLAINTTLRIALAHKRSLVDNLTSINSLYYRRESHLNFILNNSDITFLFVHGRLVPDSEGLSTTAGRGYASFDVPDNVFFLQIITQDILGTTTSASSEFDRHVIKRFERTTPALRNTFLYLLGAPLGDASYRDHVLTHMRIDTPHERAPDKLLSLDMSDITRSPDQKWGIYDQERMTGNVSRNIHLTNKILDRTKLADDYGDDSYSYKHSTIIGDIVRAPKVDKTPRKQFQIIISVTCCAAGRERSTNTIQSLFAGYKSALAESHYGNTQTIANHSNWTVDGSFLGSSIAAREEGDEGYYPSSHVIRYGLRGESVVDPRGRTNLSRFTAPLAPRTEPVMRTIKKWMPCSSPPCELLPPSGISPAGAAAEAPAPAPAPAHIPHPMLLRPRPRPLSPPRGAGAGAGAGAAAAGGGTGGYRKRTRRRRTHRRKTRSSRKRW
jgi:hypothetical protein